MIGGTIPALMPGTRVDGYEIVRALGRRGGFGITYLGRADAGRREVAIKEYLPGDFARRVGAFEVRPNSEEDQETFDWGLKSFLNEARVLSQFDHPNIVRMLGLVEAHRTAYLVMEYVPGETLGDHLRRVGRMDVTAAMSILVPLLDGLEIVHGAGVLHRDVNPHNILLRANGSPVLIDFGSARQALGARLRATQQAGDFTLSVCTSGYAPIEQYGPRDRQGSWTDVYALAAVGYRLLTGNNPVDALTRRNRDPMPAALAAATPDHPALAAALESALKLKAQERPQTAAALRAAMDPGGKFARSAAAAPPAARRTWVLWAVAVLLGIVVLGLSLWMLHGRG